MDSQSDEKTKLDSPPFHSGGVPPGNSVGSMVGAVVMGLVTAGLGALFCVVLYQGFLRADDTKQWIETPCEVVKAWVDEGRTTADSAMSYQFKIEYKYTFKGSEYTGTRIKRVDGRTSMRSKADTLAEAYPTGSEIVCFVNPESPEDAILKHNSGAVIFTIWFPGLFVIGGLGIAVTGVRGWLTRRKHLSDASA